MLIGTLAVAAVVGGTMVATGRPLDPWSVALAVALTLAGSAAARRGRVALGRRDGVDDTSTIGDGRLALDLIEAELTRSADGGVFSVAVVEVGHATFDGVADRRVARVLDELVHALARDTRLDDRVCHTAASDRELVLVVLPDTGVRGARALTARLHEQVRRHLVAADLSPGDDVRTTVLTHPADRRDLLALRRRLEVLDGSQALIEDVRIRGRRPRPVDEPTVTIQLPE